MTETDNLNVNKPALQFRLSRMQKIILSVLKNEPYISIGRLGRFVAQEYGNDSFMSFEEYLSKRQAQIKQALEMPEPDKGNLLFLLNFDAWNQRNNRRKRYGHRSPKFNVSFCRSLKNLTDKGLIHRFSEPGYRHPWVKSIRCTHVNLNQFYKP